MKKVLLVIFLLFLLYAPFLTVRPIKNYYQNYETIAKKYECYPIETCQADFNGDGKPDVFSRINEPNEKEGYFERLKIFVGNDNQTKEIFNSKYDHTDNTFRTHIAVFEENGQKKLVVYDTINPEQFFCWDGNKLSPTLNRTQLELEIWKAMSLNDDTGGFNQKIAIDSTLIFIFGLYYFVLLASIGSYLYFTKKRTNIL